MSAADESSEPAAWPEVGAQDDDNTERTISTDLASVTGHTRRAARMALNAAGRAGVEGAYELLMSDLALVPLHGSCSIEPARVGVSPWLGQAGRETTASGDALTSLGDFGDCLVLRVARGCSQTEVDKRVFHQRLELFALELVEVFLFSPTSGCNALDDGTEWKALPIGAACSSFQAPSLQDTMLTSCSAKTFEPGSVVLSFDEDRVLLLLARLLEKAPGEEPRNSRVPSSQRPARMREFGQALAAVAKLKSGRGVGARDKKLRDRAPGTEAKAKVNSLVHTKAAVTRFFNKARKSLSIRVSTNEAERYSLLAPIGTGAFGTVHLAQMAGGRRVAVKVVKIDSGYEIREVDMLAKMRHPCIVALVDAYECKGDAQELAVHIVMEFCPQTLHRRINGSALDFPIVRCFSFQLVRGLLYLQSLEICHRDLKPENILLADAHTSASGLRIADFGSAKILDGKPSSNYICSRWWRAPELVLGADGYTLSVDWWSCGCVIAEMILGAPLFRGQSSWGQMYEIIRVLGTPTAEDVRGLYASCTGRGSSGEGNVPMVAHVAKLAELKRPGLRWEEIVPAHAGYPGALDLLRALLVYNPSSRQTPVQLFYSPLFAGIVEHAAALPPNIFEFTPEELRMCEQYRPEMRAGLLELSARRGKFLTSLEAAAKRQCEDTICRQNHVTQLPAVPETPEGAVVRTGASDISMGVPMDLEDDLDDL